MHRRDARQRECAGRGTPQSILSVARCVSSSFRRSSSLRLHQNRSLAMQARCANSPCAAICERRIALFRSWGPYRFRPNHGHSRAAYDFPTSDVCSSTHYGGCRAPIRPLIVEQHGHRHGRLCCLSWTAVVVPTENLLSEQFRRRAGTHARMRSVRCSRPRSRYWRRLHRRASALRGPA